MNALVFVNYTTEVFEQKFDGRSYRFAPGEERILETAKAEHFAKHLIDRELQKAGADTILDPTKRETIHAKCIKSIEDAHPTDIPDEDKVFEEQVKEELKKKAGRPKKVVEANKAPTETSVPSETFEGLAE